MYITSLLHNFLVCIQRKCENEKNRRNFVRKKTNPEEKFDLLFEIFDHFYNI
ncbi:hypothetical protein GCK32_021998 [Trichostrongylus colubriformis]|uniref:Uncharacterized protein n=1 Tax=Trichostrongylus colubriformis TaxID=6319 RepID=A0AAN8IBH8_TRICO